MEFIKYFYIIEINSQQILNLIRIFLNLFYFFVFIIPHHILLITTILFKKKNY